MSDERNYCPDCQVGLIKRDTGTYYTWIENELVIVPNFPCWVCDVCGRREWDQNAIFNLGMILSPAAGTPTFERITNIPAAEKNDKPKRKARRSAIS